VHSYPAERLLIQEYQGVGIGQVIQVKKTLHLPELVQFLRGYYLNGVYKAF
jgi:hypothetical protein